MSEWVTQEAGWRDLYLRLSHDAGIYEKSGREVDLLKGSLLASALEWRKEREPNPSWANRYHPDVEPDETRRLFHRALDFLEKSRRALEEEEIAFKRRIRNRRIATALLTLLGFGLAAVFGVLTLELSTQKRQLQQAGAESERLRGQEASARIEADRQKNLALEEKGKADAERDKAEENYKEVERQRLNAVFATQQSEQDRRRVLQLLYATEMSLAQDAVERGNFTRGYELINAYLPPDPEAGLRTFPWYHIWNSVHQEIQVFKGHEGGVWSVRFSPDGKTLASAGGDYEKKDFAIRLWVAATDEDVARQRIK